MSTQFTVSSITLLFLVGTATPQRRNSTNPFEICSPDGEEPVFLDHEALQAAANEINNNSSGNVASAIADMTADFYQAITKNDFNFDATINDDVFEEAGRNKGTHELEDSNANDKPISTVTTISYDNGCPLFDPFETIHDDDALSSKRSSIENPAAKEAVIEASSNACGTNPAKAKELFNSSMASIELLASGKAAQLAPGSELSPMTPTTPPSNCDNAHLAAPQGMDVVYSSDLSDLSDVSPTAAVAASSDIRSAFNMYSGTTFSP